MEMTTEISETILVEEKNERKPPKSLADQFKNVIKNVTVEPVMMGYVMAFQISRLATQNLNLDKACRINFNYSDVLCDALISREANYENEEKLIQGLISSMGVWKSVVETAIPCFLILFLGAWSDRTGKRKICIILPIFGNLIMTLGNALNTYFFYEIPVHVTMFMEAIFPAITGGWITSYMGMFSYIAEIADDKSLTYRLGLIYLALRAGAQLGTALSGILLKKIGYYGIFGISALMNFLVITYSYWYIKDIKRSRSEEIKEKQNRTACFKSFFDINHVKDTMVTVFKSGPNRRRVKSILIFLASVLVNGVAFGELTIMYFYARVKFDFDALQFSYFGSFNIFMHSLGAAVSIGLFSRYLKWEDSVLGIISVTSHIVSANCFALAKTGTQFYLGGIIEMMNATAMTAIRSISSKLVAKDELGKMIAALNLVENFTEMVFSSFYSWVYMMVLKYKYDVSILYYLSVVIYLPALYIFVWFFFQSRNKDINMEEDKVKGSIERTNAENQDLLLSADEKDTETL